MIPFSPPYINDEVIMEVVDSLKSGWITTGPKVKALEEEIVTYTNCSSAICVNSATSGLMLMLHWFGVKRGDEVIIPAYTYCATALAVMHLGATPVMVDIGENFIIEPDAIARAINERTKAVILVDFAGMPCDYVSVMHLISSPEYQKRFHPENEIQKKLNRILIIGDAAHAFGASIDTKNIGSFGDAIVFSFHAVKNITTAEGGVICLNLPPDFDVAQETNKLKLLTLNGQTKDAYTKNKMGGWKYDIVMQGFKINLPDIAAAIALAQMRVHDVEILERREEIFDLYLSKLHISDKLIMPKRNISGRHSSCHIFPLRLKINDEIYRDKFIESLSTSGISVNVHFIPLPLLSLFKEKGFNIKNFPVAEKTYINEISLPIYPQLTDEQVDYISNTILNLLKNNI